MGLKEPEEGIVTILSVSFMEFQLPQTDLTMLIDSPCSQDNFTRDPEHEVFIRILLEDFSFPGSLFPSKNKTYGTLIIYSSFD